MGKLLNEIIVIWGRWYCCTTRPFVCSSLHVAKQGTVLARGIDRGIGLLMARLAAILLSDRRIVDGPTNLSTRLDVRHVLSAYEVAFGIPARCKLLDNVLPDVFALRGLSGLFIHDLALLSRGRCGFHRGTRRFLPLLQPVVALAGTYASFCMDCG